MKHSEAIAKIEEIIPDEFKLLHIDGRFLAITKDDELLLEGQYFVANIRIAVPIIL